MNDDGGVTVVLAYGFLTLGLFFFGYYLGRKDGESKITVVELDKKQLAGDDDDPADWWKRGEAQP